MTLPRNNTCPQFISLAGDFATGSRWAKNRPSVSVASLPLRKCRVSLNRGWGDSKVYMSLQIAQQAGLRKERTPSGHSVIHPCGFPVSFLPNVATFLHLKKREGEKKLWSGKSWMYLVTVYIHFICLREISSMEEWKRNYLFYRL